MQIWNIAFENVQTIIGQKEGWIKIENILLESPQKWFNWYQNEVKSQPTHCNDGILTKQQIISFINWDWKP